LGAGTAVWSINGVNPQRENRINGVAITPDFLSLSVVVDGSLTYNLQSEGAQVPEPISVAIWGVGLVGVIASWRRKHMQRCN
jgi:hypothetical protein